MTMSMGELATDLQAMCGSAANRLSAANLGDFRRSLTLAAAALALVRPRTLRGTVTLEAGTAEYALPDDCVLFKVSEWGVIERQQRKPWDDNWPGLLPRARQIESNGEQVLYLSPAPTAGQITALGSTYPFYYLAAHTIGNDAANTTVRTADRHLLLIRALVFCLKQIANDQSNLPVQLGANAGTGPKNGTPAALADAWLKEYEALAA